MTAAPVRIGGLLVGGGQRCFIIAEAGVNHNGDIGLAHALVDAAADAGADAVKFQTWKTDAVIARGTPKVAYQEGRAAGAVEDQYDMLKRLELPQEAHADLQTHAHARGLLFLSTPDDLESARFLVELGVPAIKVGSAELDNLDFLRALARFGLPLIVSTGMGNQREVAAAAAAVEGAGNPPLVFLHAVSAYPAPIDDMNIRAIAELRAATGHPAGLSDHYLGFEAAVAAVGVGLDVWEKHFTTSRALPGPDQHASLEPHELRAQIAHVRRAERALGTGAKHVTASESGTLPLVRRRLHLRRALAAGAAVSRDDVEPLRGARGIGVHRVDDVIGKRLVRAVASGQPLVDEDLGIAAAIEVRVLDGDRDDAASGDWDRALEEFPAADVHHERCYAHAMAVATGGRALLLLAASEEAALAVPLVVRPVPPGFGEDDAADAETPYGYAGPLFRGDGAHAPALWRAICDALRARGIVNAFLRFSLHGAEAARPPAELSPVLVEERELAAVPLADGLHEAFAGPQCKTHRSQVHRAEAIRMRAMVTEAPSAEAFERFHGAYLATMERVSSSAFYRFPLAALHELRRSLGSRMAIVDVSEPGAAGRIVCSGLFLRSGHAAHYWLSARAVDAHNAAGNLMLHRAAQWAARSGTTVLHLGGGRSGGRDDALLAFKLRVGRARAAFRAWGLVVDAPRHQALCAAADRAGWFQAYRAPPAAPASPSWSADEGAR